MKFEAMERELYHLKGPNRKGMDHPEFFKILNEYTQGMNPKENIVVVGTNGKGTTSQLIFHILRAQGYRVGLFTSPHLVHLSERFRFEDRCATEDELMELRELIKQRHRGMALSFFEVLTLMALEWFKNIKLHEGLDFIVWEAGLGGRFDPAAQVPHHLTVLTTISLDHQELLGNSLREIAFQKLGAVSKGGVLISNAPHGDWQELLQLELAEKNAQHLRADVECPAHPEAAVSIASKKLVSHPGQALSTPWGRVQLQLLGPMAAANLQLALCAAHQVAGELKNLDLLSGVQFWGRGQWVPGFKVPVLLSGDHNQEGWEHLAGLLKRDKHKGVIYFRLSKEQKLQPFHKVFSQLPGFELKHSQLEDLKQEFDDILSLATEGDVVVITGSLYFIGDWLKAMNLTP